MARDLGTLNEEEMGLVNEWVESGIAESHEQALQLLIDTGAIADDEFKGGNGSYIPEGFVDLKFHNGHQKSAFTKVDKMSKKAKQDSPFEIENWYLGSKFPKDDDKNIILEEVEKGYELGMTPEIVVTHILYKGARFNPSEPKETIDTILGRSMYPKDQVQMIDKKTKKNLSVLREELFKEFGGKDKVPSEKKIKFVAVVYGLVKTEDGWKKFQLEAVIGKPEYNTIQKFLEEACTKQKTNTPIFSKYLCEIATEEDIDNGGNYFKIITIKEELSEDLRKEIIPLVGECAKSVSKFLADQKESVKGNSENTQEKDPEEEDEQIDWD